MSKAESVVIGSILEGIVIVRLIDFDGRFWIFFDGSAHGLQFAETSS